jgi:acyl carrier protein
MAQSNSEPISFDEFRGFLAEILLIDQEKLTREASLINDLCVDSLRWVEMALRVEQLGVQIPSEAFWDINTVGDAYDMYVAAFRPAVSHLPAH